MRKGFLAVALMALCAGKASAQTPTFETAYSSFMVTAVRCSSGTVIRLNSARPTGFTANIAGYRVQNQGSQAVWIGGPSISTGSAVGDSLSNFGEKLETGASAAYYLGKSYLISGAAILPIYCKAADAAGASGAIVSLAWFGY